MDSRNLGWTMTAAAILVTAACGSDRSPASPTPTGEPPVANVYILPGAGDLGPNAFGDEPIVIFKGERMRWQNIDTVEHNVAADTPALPEFQATGALAPGAERSFVMATPGMTAIHCTIHPGEVGSLIVKQR